MAALRVAVPEEDLVTDLLAHAEGRELEVGKWSVGDPPPPAPFDLLCLTYMIPAPELRRLPPGVARVLQSQTLGYDGVAEHLGPGFVYCNAVEVHEASTAELTVGLLVACQRGFPTFFDAGRRGEWAHARQIGVAGSRVLLLGVGGVGREICRRLEAFEVDLVRVGRRAREDAFGTVHSVETLDELLPGADIVILAVPLDDTTRGMVSHDFLGRMADGALLVNVARGPVVDTDALTDAVAGGRIRAALDVTDPEPLPPDHPLWSAPTVFITPHIGGFTAAMRWRMRRVLLRQIDCLVAGQEPTNIIFRT